MKHTQDRVIDYCIPGRIFFYSDKKVSYIVAGLGSKCRIGECSLAAYQAVREETEAPI